LCDEWDFEGRKMKHLPDGWDEVELSEILESIENGNRPKGGITDLKDGIPSFGGEHINSTGGFNLKNVRLIPTDFYNSMKRGKIKKGDVLVVKDGATTGKVSFVDDDFPFESAAVNEHVFILRGKKDLVYQKFLFYHLYSPIGQRQMDVNFHGAAIGGINTQFIKNYNLILPPLPTQKKIAAILEKAEKLREWRKEADGLTDRFLKSTFLEMFGDPIKNPKKWEKRAIKEFGKVMTGNTPPRMNSEYYGNYIEWIKSDNINTPYTYLTKSEEMLSEAGAKVGRIVPKGSVLITCIAGSLSCIGNVAIADREVAFNQQINAIVPNKEVNEFFLYHLILNAKEYIQNFSTQSMKGMLSKSVFESIPFISPPTDLQNKFGSIANEIEELRKFQNQSRQHIDHFFNVLMQKAFNGELET